MTRPSVITIDGPAASGKSTVGQRLAKALGYLYFDTGVIYRAVTLAALRRKLDLADEEALVRLAEQIRIDVIPPTLDDGRQYTVLIDGEDVTWDLRRPEVEAHVSLVSAYPGVRAALLTQQRRIAAGGRVVMVGRDIGTVVVPDADLKIYLDASPEERARRRYLELRARGQLVDYEEILTAMRQRDQTDSQRATAPLRPAEDAIIVDSTHMDIEAVLNHILALVQNFAGEDTRTVWEER
ncbi:MAG: (d)CMP kinase [Anaerolineae bacterium]|nr:(d)CMP kinase [Anaerolineae bacterium]MDW8101043.1 (d)CMP kinase [Anaerolineae bacterium]